jgi:hypothetical protein
MTEEIIPYEVQNFPIETTRKIYVDAEQLDFYQVVSTGGVVKLRIPEDETYEIIFSPNAAFRVGRAMVEASQDPVS